jgi:hypothetical protein
MANNVQMKKAIEEAKATVAEYGYKGKEVDTRDVLLAGFGYLADKLDAHTIILRFGSKKAGAATVGLGSGIFAVLGALLMKTLSS